MAIARFNPNTLTHADFYRTMFGMRTVVTADMRDAAHAAAEIDSPDAAGELDRERDEIHADLADAGIPMNPRI